MKNQRKNPGRFRKRGNPASQLFREITELFSPAVRAPAYRRT